jgi:hypothetical protein
MKEATTKPEARTIHVRTDYLEGNSQRTFGCGIGPALPEGHVWHHADEISSHRANCPGCRPFARTIGTPLSQLSGRPGHPGFDRFCAIAETYGYD